MIEKSNFLTLIKVSIEQLILHRNISEECDVNEHIIGLHDKIISHFRILGRLVSETELLPNYINQFTNDVNQTLNSFPYRQSQDLDILQNNNKLSIKNNIEKQILPIEKQLELLEFNLNFFQKLNFFNNNIVAIGANGSGKTTLSNDLKKYLPKNGVVISAQKVLIIPTFSGISNFDKTNKQLESSQTADKSLRVTYSTENNSNAYGLLSQLGSEYKILLDNLIAERSTVRNKFCDSLLNGAKQTNVPSTRLDKALSIWNKLIEHRILECDDGVNITLKSKDDLKQYPAHKMSDGEKVTLYLIAHVLQAPPSGFIIVDEPEMYLHKTILRKLWDALENERQDCIFVYLTHDLDFATSRTTAKKVWIRSFKHPNNWEIENIPENELPEPLLLELLGSRKDVLFCEGKNGSIDEKIYNVLFPNFTITPVDNCLSVINYTKAFNKIPNSTTKAIGLIDSDHHGTARLSALEPEGIFSFLITEPENLLLDEEFLNALADQLLLGRQIVKSIKDDIISKLKDELELQVSNYVSAKINYYFKDSHVSKGNTLNLVEQNFALFTSEIKIQEWYEKRKLELEEIIQNKDYEKVLSVFNNKGLKAIAYKHLKISNFTDRAINLLQFKQETHEMIKKHFPNRITSNNNGL